VKDYVDALEPHKHNRYTYCYNNPINRTDPLGLDADKKETDLLSIDAKQETEGQKKDETAGKQPTGTEQKGKTSEDVKGREGVQKEGSDKSGVDKSDTKSDHRESLTVTEAGDKILTISEGARSQAINLGNDPQSFGGKHDTQVAQGTGLSESGKKVAGVAGALVLNAAEEAISETAKSRAGGALQAVGKSGALGVATEALDRSFKIHAALTDAAKGISSDERAALASLHVSAGAATVLGGIGGGVAGGAIGSAFGGVGIVPGTIAGAAVGATAVEKITDWAINEQREIYRYNN
jgi:hypothetical protein